MLRVQNIEAVFAQRLKEVRNSLNLSQAALAAALAERCGMELDPTAITRMERGSRRISLAEAHAITTVLGVNLDDMCSVSDAADTAALKFALAGAERDAGLAGETLALAESQQRRALAQVSRLRERLKTARKEAEQ